MPAIAVTVAKPNEREAALNLLFARYPSAERLARIHDVLAAARHREISLEGLLIARRGEELVGTALGVFPTSPGGTAFVWPPVSPGSDPRGEVADALLQDLTRRIEVSGAALGQSLLEEDDSADRSALVRNGFIHLADLVYLERRLDQSLPPPSRSNLERIRFRPGENAERFARLLERTYAGTLDCPGLGGKRTGREALESHRQTGAFDPERWSAYCVGGSDVGVVLLTDHPDEDAWEIVYLGVVPEARGRGYGRKLVLDGLHRARDAGRRRMLLAVDSRNHFARRVYDDLGFEELTMRSAYVRTRC